MIKWSAIIPAAGSGVRMASKTPKPFLKLKGKSILEHTIRKLVEVPGLSHLIIAAPKTYIAEAEKIGSICKEKEIRFTVIEGADERQYSIQKALDLLHDESELVAIHDAVRPFVSISDFKICVETAQKFDGAVLGVPVRDTIKKADQSGKILSTPDRNRLWQAQTPQIFKKDVILKAYEWAGQNNYLGTDDASLTEKVGAKIQMVEGDSKNIKITFPFDLKIAELLIT